MTKVKYKKWISIWIIYIITCPMAVRGYMVLSEIEKIRVRCEHG